MVIRCPNIPTYILYINISLIIYLFSFLSIFSYLFILSSSSSFFQEISLKSSVENETIFRYEEKGISRVKGLAGIAKRKREKILDRRIMTLRGGDARLRVSRFSKRLLSFCIRRKKRKYEGQKGGGCWMEVLGVGYRKLKTENEGEKRMSSRISSSLV